MIVRSKAPFRVSFGGGGTDMPPYFFEHKGCVINTTIDRHVYITLKPRKDKKIHVFSLDYDKEIFFNIGDNNYNEEFEIFKGIINILAIKDGFDIVSYSELPTGSGMGGSSSLCVALIGAFNEYYKLGLNIHQIAQKACFIERTELKQEGGYQDQFAAAYGGFNYIEFSNDIKVIPLKITEDMKNELLYSLILCYVGGSHFSSDIQKAVLNGYKIEKNSYMESMQSLKDIACMMRDILESNDLTRLIEFGDLLHTGWLAKKSLSSKITNDTIENFYLISRKYGVHGGKLLGAGGGGHLLLFSEPDKKCQVIKELEKLGGQIIDFHFYPKGLEVWRINED